MIVTIFLLIKIVIIENFQKYLQDYNLTHLV